MSRQALLAALDALSSHRRKIRVSGQALREQRAEPGPSLVKDATRKVPDNRVSRGFRELGRRYLKQARGSPFRNRVHVK
jgi:hypothetical protein